MSDDAELTEEDIRFNAHALLRSLFGRIDHIRQDKKWAELENSDIITYRRSQTIINIIDNNSNKVGNVSQCISKHFGAFLEGRQT